MAMAYLLHPEERIGLEILSGVWLGLPPYKGIDYKNILDEDLEDLAAMNARDVCRTFNLYRPLADELNKQPHLSRTYQWLLRPAIAALVDITVNGVPVDQDRLGVLAEEVEAEVEELLARLRALTRTPQPTARRPGRAEGSIPTAPSRWLTSCSILRGCRSSG
jgi:DNA polymerase I-like protein with 3'-5' exonuclease and polymerase domains